MEQQLSPEMLDEQEQIKVLEKHGVDPDKMRKVIDDVINGDLTDKTFKRSGKPITQAENKQKEVYRIVKNFGVVLAALNADLEAGKDNEAKNIIKRNIMVGAVAVALGELGLEDNEILAAIGIPAIK